MQDISLTIPIRGYARSSSFKMALLFTFLLGSSVCILGYFSYYFNQTSFIQGTESVIDTEMHYLLQKELLVLPKVEKRIYLLMDHHNNRLSGDLIKLPENIMVLSEGIILFDSGQPKKKYAAKIRTFEDGRKLLIGMDITQSYNNSVIMKRLSFISITLMVLVIGFSFLISTFVVNRTGNIARIAHNIMRTGDLSQRIEQNFAWDDLGYMTQVLNALLKKIEELMGNIKQVSDNIAHDLQTPLTRLRNRLENLQKEVDARGDKELSLMCGALTDEADHILSTFSALLRIASVEAGQQKQNFSKIRLDDIVHDVIDLYEPLAEEKHLFFEVKTIPTSYFGDKNLIFQAFANVLDNAIKFTPDGSKITIELNEDKKFSITDSGPGIIEADKDKIFRRFYRAESSRNSRGNGLGLSLVAAVIAMHEGTIELENMHPGLKASMIF